jgi:glutamyl-tRNA reductase
MTSKRRLPFIFTVVKKGMLQKFKVLSVTHKRVNLKRLAHFVVGDPMPEKLRELKARFGLSELLYLATCNRVLFFFLSEESLDLPFARDFFEQVNPDIGENELDKLADSVTLLEGLDALSHLYEVAASMDSLVVGEREILRQLREAFEQCRDWGLTGPWLQLAFQQAQVAAKEIYSTTRIGEKPISVVSLAMQQMMRQPLEKDARILLVGAGQTNSLVGKFLLKYGFQNVKVFNRTLGRAKQLAAYLGGEGFSLKQLAEYEKGFDCLIVCTGSRKSVITPELYGSLVKGDTSRKVLIDLSVPHNVSPEVLDQFPVHYTEIEGLRHLAKENLAFREQEVQVARKQLEGLLKEFPAVLQQRQMEIAMRQVPEQIKSVRKKAMSEVFRKEMDGLDPSTQELIERMMHYMEKKCIGIPMRVARTAVLSES